MLKGSDDLTSNVKHSVQNVLCCNVHSFAMEMVKANACFIIWWTTC